MECPVPGVIQLKCTEGARYRHKFKDEKLKSLSLNPHSSGMLHRGEATCEGVSVEVWKAPPSGFHRSVEFGLLNRWQYKVN